MPRGGLTDDASRQVGVSIVTLKALQEQNDELREKLNQKREDLKSQHRENFRIKQSLSETNRDIEALCGTLQRLNDKISHTWNEVILIQEEKRNAEKHLQEKNHQLFEQVTSEKQAEEALRLLQRDLEVAALKRAHQAKETKKAVAAQVRSMSAVRERDRQERRLTASTAKTTLESANIQRLLREVQP